MIHFQTQLAINTCVTVADVRDDVANVRAAVSEVQRDTANTCIMVSNMHHSTLKSQEGADDRYQLVGGTGTLPIFGYALTIS